MVDHIKLGNRQIKVVSDEEAEQATFVVCGPFGTVTPFSDNVETTCGLCGTSIIHRPHMPVAPVKICISCATTLPTSREGIH